MDSIFVLVFGNSDLIKFVLILRIMVVFTMLKQVVIQFLDSWIEKTLSKIIKASPYTARK